MAAAPVAPVQPVVTWALQSLWLGLMSGWAECGVILGHKLLVGTITRGTVRLNRYFLPLGLLAHLAIFAAGMGLATLLANRWTRSWWRDSLVTWMGFFLALSSPLLAIEELHWLSGLILAAALSLKLAPWWIRHRGAVLRRTLLPLGITSALLGCCGFALVHSSEQRALAGLPPARPEAPNVVLIVLDTVRADHLSLYGYHRRTTPHLDALAKHAIIFDFARSAAPWTLPSHATMFTGRWPNELSVDYDRPLDGTHPTLAEYLGGHGYLAGGFVGNTFYCNSWFGVARGFAHYEDTHENQAISTQETLRSAALTRLMMPLAVRWGLWPTTADFPPRKTAEEVNRNALAWLDGRAGQDRPFFLFLNYIDVHGPYLLPESFPREYSRANRKELVEASSRARDERLPIDERFEALDRIGVDAYDDCIRYVDEQIDRLLTELDRRGKGRNTWVIVTADHGEHFGEHGIYRHGNSLLRPLVDVPLLIVPPRGDGLSGRVTTPVSIRDLPATVADMLGLGSASPFPGQSLRHHWDDTLSASGPIEAPRSELKLPAGTANLHTLPIEDRHRTAFVEDGRIYHRDPLGSEALYDVSDREEGHDLLADPAEAPALEHFRDLGREIRDARR
ncbi:sulfatase [Tundrisphaera sp. TA3]|uniref:sulfatase n=1 Tax=Tundrisphaera sp. TA3 TaxID=3435775 RepID=UPI003EBB5C02